MPVRLLATIILMVLVAIFTGFNLDNKCDIWLFHTFKAVPVFVTILTSFVAGVIVMLPFTLRRKTPRVREEKAKKTKKASKQPLSTDAVSSSDVTSSADNGSSE